LYFYLGISWDTETRLFPKTTLCDFTVREFGHPKLAHEYTVPCVLPMNLFNQQMFTVLYFWYTMIILLNIGDFFLWLYTFSPQNRRAFIRKRLHSKKHSLINDINELSKISAFTHDYLEADGFFILTLIKDNSSDYVATEVIHRLYTERFLPRYLHETTTTTTSTIYDDIDMRNDTDSKRSHLCSLIC